MTSLAQDNKILFTLSDESPLLGAASFVPMAQHFLAVASIGLETNDISLQHRILAAFDLASDDLATLKHVAGMPQANIIKTPNVSATEGQLKITISELQAQGYNIPDYPDAPQNEAEQAIQKKYKAVMGSAVNPALRQGDGLRWIPDAVKQYAQENPHEMGEWSQNSRTRVAHMTGGDFYATEQSSTIAAEQAGKARIEFVSETGEITVLKDGITLKTGDIVDAAAMSRKALNTFLQETIAQAKDEDFLFSLHLKSTMMINTDGVMFGDAVKAYFAEVFAKHEDTLKALKFEPKNGLSDIDAKLEKLEKDGKADDALRASISALKADIQAHLQNHAPLAMANHAKGITHLDAPNNVLVDVSMANVARWGGKQTDHDNQFRDTIAVIPDTTYAKMHTAVIDNMKAHGALDPRTAGTVFTARLQTNGAEEYGSKDTTFNAPANGIMRIVAENGEVLHTQAVEAGDIFRMCKTEDAGIRNWMKIGLDKARETDAPAVFWLDENRPHDREIIRKVQSIQLLGSFFMNPEDAADYTLNRMRRGLNTTALAGNVMGDHITDLFPILEVAMSTKMYSEVSLLQGGRVNETGSAGTAPLLLSDLLKKNHFAWDDLGSYLGLEKALAHLGQTCGEVKAQILAQTLAQATDKYVLEGKSPSEDGLDTRESQFHLMKFWAQAVASQAQDSELASAYANLAISLRENEAQILAELKAQAGQPVDLGGRYAYDPTKVNAIMRPSPTLNSLFTLEL